MFQKVHVSMFEACQAYSTCAFRILFFFSLNLSAVQQISSYGSSNLQKTKAPANKFVFFLLTEIKKPNIIRNYQMEIIQSPFLCRSLIKLLCTMLRLHLSLLRQTLDLLLSVGQVCHESVCVCVCVCVCVGCRAWLLATEMQITPKILCANLEGCFSLSLSLSPPPKSFLSGSLEEFGSISLMILNGAAVAVCGLLVCRRCGDGAAELHSTSLGPGLPSWSHIKEQPCLSTCAGWSAFRFPLCWSSFSRFRCIHTYTKCTEGGEGMIRCSVERRGIKVRVIEEVI